MSRRWFPMLVALVMGLATLAATMVVRAADDSAHRAASDRSLETITNTLQSITKGLEARVQDTASLFQANDEVSAAEFRRFVEPVFTSSYAWAVGYIEVVPDSRRAAYERARGFKIVEVTPSKELRPAFQRPQYAVARFVRSRTPTRSTLGVNITADPGRASALQRASATGTVQASPSVTLPTSGERGFVLYSPIYANPTAPGVTASPVARGFAFGSFQYSDLRVAAGRLLRQGDAVEVRDGTEVVARAGTLGDDASHSHFNVAGKQIEISVSAPADAAVAFGIGRGGSALIVGLLLTILGTLAARLAHANAIGARELVTLRQAERDQAVRERETSERATAALLAQLPDLAVMRFDQDLRLSAVGGGLIARTGWSMAALEGKTIDELFPPASSALITDAMRRSLQGEECSVEPPDALAGMRLVAQTLPLPGSPPQGLLVTHNLNALLTEQAARRSAEQRFERAFTDAPIGMALLDGDGRFLQVNEALCGITGYDEATLTGRSSFSITHPDDVELDRRQLGQLGTAGATTVQVEKRYVQPSGRVVWVAVHSTLIEGSGGELGQGGSGHPVRLAQVLDITERREFEEQLQHLADHDPLTGLANRRAFAGVLAMHVASIKRYGIKGALLMLDLDYFKAVNDTLGHHAGDELLKAIAEMLRGELRESDAVFRLGGDEFAVLLPEADATVARTVAGKLCDQVRAYGAQLAAGNDGAAPGPPVTASIGVVMFSEAFETLDQALVAADRAMYAAKAAGRDRVEMDDAAVAAPGSGAPGSGA